MPSIVKSQHNILYCLLILLTFLYTNILELQLLTCAEKQAIKSNYNTFSTTTPNLIKLLQEQESQCTIDNSVCNPMGTYSTQCSSITYSQDTIHEDSIEYEQLDQQVHSLQNNNKTETLCACKKSFFGPSCAQRALYVAVSIPYDTRTLTSFFGLRNVYNTHTLERIRHTANMTEILRLQSLSLTSLPKSVEDMLKSTGRTISNGLNSFITKRLKAYGITTHTFPVQDGGSISLIPQLANVRIIREPTFSLNPTLPHYMVRAVLYFQLNATDWDVDVFDNNNNNVKNNNIQLTTKTQNISHNTEDESDTDIIHYTMQDIQPPLKRSLQIQEERNTIPIPQTIDYNKTRIALIQQIWADLSGVSLFELGLPEFTPPNSEWRDNRDNMKPRHVTFYSPKNSMCPTPNDNIDPSGDDEDSSQASPPVVVVAVDCEIPFGDVGMDYEDPRDDPNYYSSGRYLIYEPLPSASTTPRNILIIIIAIIAAIVVISIAINIGWCIARQSCCFAPKKERNNTATRQQDQQIELSHVPSNNVIA